MNVTRIISSGLTVYDQIVLDAALLLGLPYTGWRPKRGIAAAYPLPEKYRLELLDTGSFLECIEKSVQEADATLILASGKVHEDQVYAQKTAHRNQRQLLLIDLESGDPAQSATRVHDWILKHNIQVLYIMGPYADKDDEIQEQVAYIVEGALLLGALGAPPGACITDYFQRR